MFRTVYFVDKLGNEKNIIINDLTTDLNNIFNDLIRTLKGFKLIYTNENKDILKGFYFGENIPKGIKNYIKKSLKIEFKPLSAGAVSCF